MPGVAWLQGSAVYIDPPVRDLGDVAAGHPVDVKFRLQSLRSEPVRVVGAAPDCSCIAIDGMPLTLTENSPATLTIRFKPGQNDIGLLTKRVIPLHLNVDSVTPAIVIKARVRSSS